MPSTSDVVLGAVPLRLCTTKRLPRSSISEDLVTTSLHWQRIGVVADFWGMGGAGGFDRPERLYEIAGLMASIGEQLALAATSDFEVDCWHALRPARKKEHGVGREMAARALVELEAHYLLGIGHSLANLIGRMVALDGAARPLLQQSLDTTFPPSSTDKKDWPQLQTCTRRLPAVVAQLADRDLDPLVDALTRLGQSAEWTGLEGFRGQDFHRWRQQSAGLVGAVRGAFGETTTSGRSVYAVGMNRVIGVDIPAQTAADSHQIAKKVLTALPTTMNEIENHLGAPLERLTALRVKP